MEIGDRKGLVNNAMVFDLAQAVNISAVAHHRAVFHNDCSALLQFNLAVRTIGVSNHGLIAGKSAAHYQ